MSNASGEAQAQTTPDGRYLIFDTHARLVTTGPEADTDNAQDVYRYDALTGQLNRVSIGEPSFSASHNGNTEDTDATTPSPGSLVEGGLADVNDKNRQISNDGSDVLFWTPERLQGTAENTTSETKQCAFGAQRGCNVYLWHYRPAALTEGSEAF
jgi:hypothetical protein